MRAELGTPAIAIVIVTASWCATPAYAHCRTSTCPLPPDFSPSSSECEPAGFAQYCASLDPPVRPLPIWWRNACQSYDVQQAASKQVPYDAAVQEAAKAFSQWRRAACKGGGHPTVDATNLGPVSCDEVHYNADQGNQNVIVFRDKDWPYPSDLNSTLGVTTVTFDRDTGELYDADIEINSTIALTVGGPVPPDGTDFLSIITHEAGHFFGLAHSGDRGATMYGHYISGSTTMRNLDDDDRDGICSIYPPSGAREVDPGVAPGSSVEEDTCDPTPRNGLLSPCTDPNGGSGHGQTASCAVGVRGVRDRPPASDLATLIVLGAAAARARGRPRKGRARP